jgi:hypothetical protein
VHDARHRKNGTTGNHKERGKGKNGTTGNHKERGKGKNGTTGNHKERGKGLEIRRMKLVKIIDIGDKLTR